MRKLLGAVLVLVCTPVGASLAQGTVSSGPPMEADAQLRARLYETMKADLRALVAAQRTFLAERSEYAREFTSNSRTGIQLRVSPGVTITLTYVTRGTYAARATHEWLPRRSCILMVGDIPPSRELKTALEGKAGSEDGLPVCDLG